MKNMNRSLLSILPRLAPYRVLCALWAALPAQGLADDAPPPGQPPHPVGVSGHHGHGMPHRFEHAEEWVSRFEGPDRDAWQKPAVVISALGDLQGKVVADLGAGTGYFVPPLVQAVGEKGRVIALDVEPDMVRYLQKRVTKSGWKTVEVKQCASTDPGLAPASVDRILVVDVWHHLPERAAYTKKLAAALKPGGGLYIVDFLLTSHHGPPVQHRLSPAQVIAELRAGGLQAQQHATTLPDQYIVVGTLPKAPPAPPK
jgi:SAM-dependent methyltransferase